MTAKAREHAQASLRPGELSHADVQARHKASMHTQNALAVLLQKKAITHADVLHVLADFVADGIVSVDDARAIGQHLPASELLLRELIEHMQQVAIHAGVMLTAEAQSRGLDH